MYGFGSCGRYAGKAAYDDIIQAGSGFAMPQEKIVGRLPTCLARSPSLVYARITGWGQDGPLAQTAGQDLNCIR